MTTSELSLDALRTVPKVLLHDHLDGGLRPQTIIDLAAECGHPLPGDAHFCANCGATSEREEEEQPGDKEPEADAGAA